MDQNENRFYREPTKINPFGRVHDYLFVSIGDNDNYLVVSDGTTTIRLDALIVEPASNFEKPHQIRNESGTISMMLTNIQLGILLTQYLRLFGKTWEDTHEKTVETTRPAV